MPNFRAEQTDNEKLARLMAGPDGEAVHFEMNGQSAEDLLLQQKAAKFNQSVGDLQEKFEEHINEIQEIGKKMSEDLQNLEIMPLTSYALITPYKTNPFQKISTSDSGIITDLGGLTPTYKNQENGNYEEEEQYVRVGMVVEVGTECKFLKPGDIVFFNRASEVMVPFFRFGFVVVAEQRIIAVVNENLTQRKKDAVNKKDA